MQTKTTSPQEKTIDMLEAEVRALETLINRRQEWLDNSANFESRKYGETRRDTLDKIWKLEELRNQVTALKQTEDSTITHS